MTTEPTGHRNPIARTISTRNEWEALPVGTLARVGYIDHAEDGSDIDGGIMFVIRVDGDFQTKAGDYMLAGGRYWSETWDWENGVTVADLDALLPDRTGPGPVPGTADAVSVIETALAAHTKRHEDLMQMPVSKYRLIPADELPPVSPAAAILEALTSHGWAPPPVYPEGVQVWTISGIPDGGRSDGTQAYLSLPNRTGPDRFDYQDRGDIWLERPSVTVNFEVPARTHNY